MITGIVAVIGIILRMGSGRTSSRHVGDILLGFAVLMYGMSAMSGAVSPLRESPLFIDLLTQFSNPILGILLGMLFTAAIQSASAAVGILQALSVTGAVTFDVASENLVSPAVMAAMGSVLYYGLNAAFEFSFHSVVLTSVSIALVNTLFRLMMVLVEAPLIPLLERFVKWLFPTDPATLLQEQDMDRLEERFLEHPALSIEQSRTC